VTDDRPTSLTAHDRLAAAGISAERIETHLNAGRVRVDGKVVTDPRHPAPPPMRVVLTAE
jgi:hypothetical protein